MLMKMKESKFGAPAGVYRAEFLGCAPFKGDGQPRLGRDGKPMGEAVEWQFKITDGEQAGQIVGRITGMEPTTKNACGRLLAGVAGRVLRPDEAADPGQYVGQAYQVVVAPSKDNPDKTQVDQVFAVKGAAAPTPGLAPPGSYLPPPAPPPRAAAPPPRAAAPPPPSPARASANGEEPSAKAARLDARWWIAPPGEEVQEVTGQQLQLRVNGCATQVAVDDIGVMDHARACGGWKTPGHFGFKRDDVPF